MEHSKTLKAAGSSTATGPTLVTFLIRIGQSHRPYRPEPRIIDLDQYQGLKLGRGDEEKTHKGADNFLHLALSDPWMSGQHAVIVRQQGSSGPANYLLQDQQSTNGCFVNGQQVKQHTLCDGDIIETGQTYWRLYHGPVEDRLTVWKRAFTGGEIQDGAFATTCPVLLDALAQLEQIASTKIPVILQGESGTGKEVMTSVIHAMAGRSGRFVALNCAAIPEGLIESELFGHRKGAFTGALTDKRGMVEEANQGTLLLDEIGDMPLAAQAKVLRVLQEQDYVRLGDTVSRKVDVRFIAATHRDLEEMVGEGSFRGDLYARLNGYGVRLPPLRERKEDLGILLSLFMARYGQGRPLEMDNEVYRGLLLYHWPFNIRELEKTVERFMALAGATGRIITAHLPEPVQQQESPPAPAASSLNAATQPAGVVAAPAAPQIHRGASDEEITEILGPAFSRHQGNVSAVARELGHTRKQIHRWMKRVGLDPESFRG